MIGAVQTGRGGRGGYSGLLTEVHLGGGSALRGGGAVQVLQVGQHRGGEERVALVRGGTHSLQHGRQPLPPQQN